MCQVFPDDPLFVKDILTLCRHTDDLREADTPRRTCGIICYALCKFPSPVLNFSHVR